jgi:hypothetical protein
LFHILHYLTTVVCIVSSEILKDEFVIIEHFQKQGNPSHFNSNFKKEIENQLKNMEEDIND